MVVQREAHVGRIAAFAVWGAIALVLADVIAYQVLIRGQGASSPVSAATIPFVTSFMLLMALLLSLSLLRRPRLVALRPALRAAPAAGLLVLGFFALFSIGLPIFLAGILATIAAVLAIVDPHSKNAVPSGVAAAVIAVVVLVAGFVVTQRIILCPPTGSMGGSGSGFLTGAYHYECVDGTLTWHSGECNSGGQGFDANGNPISVSGC
jgi:hypothetical protein